VIALREFQYRDASGRAVTVARGQTIDEARLKESRVDLEKLARVEFVGQDEAGVVTTPRRGRRKKAG
jgi:hypothetical protein